MLAAEIVRDRLHYYRENGIFRWRVVRSPRTKVGNIAGCSDGSYGYWQISIDGRAYRAHRLAWLYVTGEWPTKQIDHINGIRDDNRFENLREATNRENQGNRRIGTNNTTGFKGVSFHKLTGRYEAFIGMNGNKRYLGLFDTPEEAHAAYWKAAREYHGEFANPG